MMQHMKRFSLRSGLGVALVFAMPLLARAQQAPTLDPKADQILKSMSQLLADSKSISFDAHAVAEQMSGDGQKLQFTKNEKVLLRRPDRLSADVVGDLEDLVFRYDGKRA